MTTSETIADALRRTVSGPVWHGSPLDEILDGVTAAHAAARAAPDVHSMWELVLHIGVWADVARRRIGGQTLEPTAAEDWPVPTGSGDSAWQAALNGMRRSYDELARAVEGLDDAALAATATGKPYSVELMTRGVVEHGAYHGGQIAILKKMVRRG